MRSLAILPFLVDTTSAGCSNVPSGSVPNGGGAVFSDILSKQSLGFHHCDGPMEDGEFASGTKCGKISCFGPNNHISVDNVECVGNNWMMQDDPEASGIPNCPRGCLGSEVYTLSRCRKHYMEGVEGYIDGSTGEHFYWPGQRCKKVQCSDTRKPRHMQRTNTSKFWKLIAKSFFECVCHPGSDTCVWSELTNAAVAAFNDDIELECAEWTAWSNNGSCENGEQKRTRECMVNEASYELKNTSMERNDRMGAPGHDCVGKSEDTIEC